MSASTRFLAVLAALGLAACSADAPSAPDEGEDARLSAGPAEHPDPSHRRATTRFPGLAAQLAGLRRATARHHNFERAVSAGYQQITPCWEHVALGAMGYHHGREWPWDLEVNLLEPELLMYEPGPGGHMRLVGMEYVVPKEPWDEVSPGAPPELLGQPFHAHASLPIYKLHLWLWRDNPRGMFADWNPKVSCQNAEATEYFE